MPNRPHSIGPAAAPARLPVLRRWFARVAVLAALATLILATAPSCSSRPAGPAADAPMPIGAPQTAGMSSIRSARERQAPPLDPRAGVPHIVYIHGFGGPQPDSRFDSGLRDRVLPAIPDARIWTHTWESGGLRPDRILHNWRQANIGAINEGQAVYRDVIQPLEAAGAPYYLVGHSLGSRVIFTAIAASPQRLEHLRGVYLLGAALPRDYQPPLDKMPADLVITNYHSPVYDTVLDVSYTTVEGHQAAGRLGFTDIPAERVANIPVACTHAEKPIPYAAYADMSDSIGWWILWRQGIAVPGDIRPGLITPVMDGNHAWLSSAEFDSPEHGHILIQQNKHTRHFRAVQVPPDGDRRRLAWGDNPHALLTHLGLAPPEPSAD